MALIRESLLNINNSLSNYHYSNILHGFLLYIKQLQFILVEKCRMNEWMYIGTVI